MDNRKLFSIIGDLNDDLILQAAPTQKKYRPQLRKVWIAAVAALLALALTVGAAAAGVPFLEDILGFLRGNYNTADIVREGELGDYVQPVTSVQNEELRGLQVTETYFDGQVLVFSTMINLEDAPDEYRLLSPTFDLKFTADGKELHPEYVMERAAWMQRITDNTYVGAVSLYPKTAGDGEQLLNLPDTFDLTVELTSLEALDNKHLVLDESGTSYEEKRYAIEEIPEAFTFTVEKRGDLRKVYEVNESKNGCTLQRITVTPAWTEIQLDVDEEAAGGTVVMLPYDSEGNELKGLYLSAGDGSVGFYDQKFRTLDEDETSVTVKFFQKENKLEPIAEFAVPVDGGYYRGAPVTKWNDFDADEIVYEPPLEEQPKLNLEQNELGESVTLSGGYLAAKSGSVDIRFENLRFYDSWQDAGISAEDMNLRDAMLENPEDYTFVLLDMVLESHDLVCNVIEDGVPTYWINCFADSTVISYEELKDRTILASDEIQYFSEHGIGFGDYYHFTLGENESKTVQVGYFVETEKLQAGDLWLCSYTNDLSKPIDELADGTVVYDMKTVIWNIPAR